MKDSIAFELEKGRRLSEEKMAEIERFNKILENTPVQLRIAEIKDFTYIIVRFDDEDRKDKDIWKKLL